MPKRKFSLNTVEALKRLYTVLGGNYEDVEGVETIFVMIDKIAYWWEEHGGGGGCDCKLATKEEVEEVAEEIMGETMDDYAYNWLETHSEDFLATEEDVKNTADDLMGMSFDTMCRSYLETHSDEFLASEQEVEEIAEDLMH